MRAVILHPGDPTADPPRPTFIGTDAGTILTGDSPFVWPSGWGALAVAPTACQAIQLDWLPDGPLWYVQTYVITLPTGAQWTMQGVYVPAAACWFVRGVPRLLPPPTPLDILCRDPLDTE